MVLAILAADRAKGLEDCPALPDPCRTSLKNYLARFRPER